MKLAGVVIGLVLVFGIQGCSFFKSSGRTPVSAAYMNGELTATYEHAGVLETVAASRAALKDFNMTIRSERKDETGGVIEAVRPDGTNVTISLRKGGDETLAGIRVGAYGDEEYSRSISNRIAAHLRG